MTCQRDAINSRPDDCELLKLMIMQMYKPLQKHFVILNIFLAYFKMTLVTIHLTLLFPCIHMFEFNNFEMKETKG